MMKNYEKLIFSMVAASSARMLIGSISVVFMLTAGISLAEIGIIKSSQAGLLLLFGFFSGFLSDRANRKSVYLFSVLFSALWLFTLYIAGQNSSFFLFFIAEVLNAISLSLFQNNSNGYLIEQFKEENKSNELNELFGKFNKYSFLFMAICSLIGGAIYDVLSAHLLLLSTFLMIMVWVCSFIFLPSNSYKTTIKREMISKLDLFILLKKFKQYRFDIFTAVIYGVIFQVIIQYWQVFLMPFNLSKNILYGFVLFLMFIIQSLAGKSIENKKQCNPMKLHIGALISILSMIFASRLGYITLFILSLCLFVYFIRIIIIETGIKVHQDLKNRLRSKYDMSINFILRLFTMLSLLVSGILSEKWGAESVLMALTCLTLLNFGYAILKRK